MRSLPLAALALFLCGGCGRSGPLSGDGETTPVPTATPIDELTFAYRTPFVVNTAGIGAEAPLEPREFVPSIDFIIYDPSEHPRGLP